MALIDMDFVNGGGGKEKTDTINQGTTTVDCGFEPKHIFLTWYTSASLYYNYWAIAVYDAEQSTTTLFYMNNKSQDDALAMGTDDSPIKSVTSTGFTIGSNVTSTLYFSEYWATST